MTPDIDNLPCTLKSGLELSAEQLQAVRVVLTSPKNVVLTGKAGSGKSTVVRWLQEYLGVTCCATTGRAALIIGGVTVDSLFCFDRETYGIWNFEYLSRVMKAATDLIVIDEASMIGARMADAIQKTADVFGKRLILVGDWAQASPVKDDWPLTSEMVLASEVVVLRQCHRQAEGPYLNALNDIRVGRTTAEAEALFSLRAGPPPREPGWLRLYATNALTDAFNTQQLMLHTMSSHQNSFELSTRFADMRGDAAKKRSLRSDKFVADAIDAAPLAHGDRFAVGAQVLLTKNALNGEYANGDVGELVGVEVSPADLPESWAAHVDSRGVCSRVPAGLKGDSVWALHVRLDRTKKTVMVTRHDIVKKSAIGDPDYTLCGFPLRLGYALTIHKSQGATVDKAWLDMASILRMPLTSRHGLAYVGLSRTKTLDGLRLSEWRPDAVFCDPAIKDFL